MSADAPAVRDGTATLAGTALFTVALGLLHAPDSGVDVIEHDTSDAAIGGHGWMMKAGFITVGVAVIADALGIRATRDRGRRVGLVIAHVPQCVDTEAWPLQRVAHG